MSEAIDRPQIPRGVLIGAGAMIALSLLLALGTRVSGIGVTRLASVDAVATRMLRFEDRSDGAVAVWDTEQNDVIEVLAPGTNGFVRGVMRGLARDRKLLGVGHEAAFKLIRWADGRMSLEDPTTGRTIALEAFGPDNSRVFAEFFGAQPNRNALVVGSLH
jgi:putative photosynthetic complex assembly protein